MKKATIIFLFLIPLGACQGVIDLWERPRPWGLGETPEGSPTFQQGWEDGCDTGLGVYGGPHYRKKAYRFRQDITQMDDPEYYRAWKDAYTYCRWYVWNWAKKPRE